MSRDVRTPEQKAAKVKCRFCPWEMPRFRQYDGQERRDVDGALAWHVERDHPEQRGLMQKMRREYGRSMQKIRDARQMASGAGPRRKIAT